MKILAISDMHGDLSCVMRLLSETSWDLVLCCGDWGDPDQLSKSECEKLLEVARIYSVFGNHDDLSLLRQLRNRDGSPVLLTNGVRVAFRDVTILGVSGIWAKSHRLPWYVTDEDVEGYAGSSERPDILITHGCAIGLNDLTPTNRRGGQLCFTRLFSALEPRVHICGHLHRMQVRRLKSGAWAANAGSAASGDYLVITTPPGDWDVTEGHTGPNGS
ncbi:MAG: metallophosphoesterase family protein [Armatimonadota bacterium]|nr:metallophosphoesterase family protein [Armatimonadota bacterium]